MNWNNYSPYFSEQEFACKHTGKCEMNKEFMDKLLELRKSFNKPMKISSGYRDGTHPVEINKTVKGAHTTGNACDILVNGANALKIIEIAISVGFTGIGVNQKGNSRFIHLDDLPNSIAFPRPTIWSY